MKITLKKVITFLAFGLFVYLGVQFYNRVRGLINLSKSLPNWLKNNFGERPTVNISMFLKKMTIKIGLSDTIIEANDDIESMVREYIEDFYPGLKDTNIAITIFAKNNTEDESQKEEEPLNETEIVEEEEIVENKEEISVEENVEEESEEVDTSDEENKIEE